MALAIVAAVQPAKADTTVGQHRPYSVSNKDRTLTILPESDRSFLASEEIELMVESADRFGVTNIQLFRDNIEIGEGQESPFRYTLTNETAGTHTFYAKAAFASGSASTSAPVTYIFTSSEPQVSLMPGPTEFISETHVKTSPAILLASVVGMNPEDLATLTLNGVALPRQTGNLSLHPDLKEGKNTFVLAATDKQGRTGTATTEVYLDTSVPVVSITEPADHSSIDAACVDVIGTFNAKNLKEIAVGSAQMNGQLPATLNENTFEARNIFLAPGTNVITVVAEDLAGNIGSNSISIAGPREMPMPGLANLPVKVQATPIAGFTPLRVHYAVQARVPGKILKVTYDFDGDGVPDLTEPDLEPVSYDYKSSGQFFPVVTIQTDVAQFSSLSGPMMMFVAMFGSPDLMGYVNVQAPPVVMSAIPIVDPVDLKWTAASNLYVLSGSAASITELDAAGKTVRSVKGIGSNPSGLDVDSQGNVYLAVTGDKVVKKFKPTADSFEPDSSFGNNGAIGAGQFSAPFDVKLAYDGQSILVSDSGSGQIHSFSLNGDKQPDNGRNIGNLKTPTGLAQDGTGLHSFIVDSGNGRIVLTSPAMDFMPEGTSGTNGPALGDFNGALHLSANKRGVYVADTGNNRVELFGPVEEGEGRSPVPFTPRVALSGELGLKYPKSVAAVDDLVEEKLYIADTGNNRVLLVDLPAETPEHVWKHMIARLKAGDLSGAVSDFSMDSKEKYQRAYEAFSKEELPSIIKGMEDIKVSAIESDTAEYYFDRVVDGQTLTFPVHFDKEFGQWKIVEF